MENLKALYRGGTGPEDATPGNLKTVTGEPLPEMPEMPKPKMGGAKRRKSRKSKKSKKSKKSRRR